MSYLGITLILIGVLLAIIGWIWAFSLAFIDDISWGLACLFIPFAGYIFILINCQRKTFRKGLLTSIYSVLITFIGIGFTFLSRPFYFLPSASHQPTYTEYMEMGYKTLSHDDYEGALIYFKKALKERPGNTYAVKAIENAQTYKRRKYKQYMQTGYKVLAQKDYEVALMYFEKAIRERPHDTYATQAIQNTKAYIKLNHP
jgi:tetratricopeptide (TPR) repeat protein